MCFVLQEYKQRPHLLHFDEKRRRETIFFFFHPRHMSWKKVALKVHSLCNMVHACVCVWQCRMHGIKYWSHPPSFSGFCAWPFFPLPALGNNFFCVLVFLSVTEETHFSLFPLLWKIKIPMLLYYTFSPFPCHEWTPVFIPPPSSPPIPCLTSERNRLATEWLLTLFWSKWKYNAFARSRVGHGKGKAGNQGLKTEDWL